jgi:hypothetical protein
MGEIER